MSQTANFQENLRSACAVRRSISELCREIGINRQQFNRYICGETLPSLHNRQRIAKAFGLRPEQLLLPSAEFSRVLDQAASGRRVGPVLAEGFPGDLHALRDYLGYYQCYYVSISWPDKIVCSCAVMREEGDGTVSFKTLERIDDEINGIHQHARYVGMVSWLCNRIFIVERRIGRQSMISQTTLTPFETHQRMFLRGVCTGVAWRRNNAPYASHTIFRYMGKRPDLRELVSRCGLHDLTDRRIPEPVSRFLCQNDMKILCKTDQAS